MPWVVKLIEWRLSFLVKLLYVTSCVCAVPWSVLKGAVGAVIDLFGESYAEWFYLKALINAEKARITNKSQVKQ